MASDLDNLGQIKARFYTLIIHVILHMLCGIEKWKLWGLRGRKLGSVIEYKPIACVWRGLQLL